MDETEDPTVGSCWKSEMSAMEDQYRNYALNQVRRIEKCLLSLSDDDKAKLDFDIQTYCGTLRAAIAKNQKFLRLYDLDIPSTGSQGFLRRWVREWSSEVERADCFDRLLNALVEHVPTEKRIWVPSAEIGRLVYEIQKRKYNVIGTETGSVQLRALEVLKTLKKNEIELQPYVTETCNRVDTDDNLRVIRIPDVDPMEYGELNISSEVPSSKSMGAIVSCFHLSQAETLRGIREIADVLEPGGIWLNTGPLDAADDDDNTCPLKLAWDEIRIVIQRFFTFAEEPRYHSAFYHSNAMSMMHTRYDCLFFRAIRNDTPIP